MVATGLRQSTSNFRGILPFDPKRDLGAVARLLEEAFRDDSTMPFSRVPLLREAGIFLWMLNYTPVLQEDISGFVWVEDGEIVGNLTLTREEGWGDRYFISNVAVKPEYRRRGIARQLVRAALEELRAHSAKWALLHVRPANLGAIELYKGFGFEEIEMRGEWVVAPPLRSQQVTGSQELRGLRPVRWADHRAIIELFRSVTPENVKRFRRKEMNAGWLYWEERVVEIITDFFIRQKTRRWVWEQTGRVRAIVVVRGQRIFSPHQIEIQVHPEMRGKIEDQLVSFALRDLAVFPSRAARAVGTSTHPELISALGREGFVMHKGLTLMTLQLRGR